MDIRAVLERLAAAEIPVKIDGNKIVYEKDTRRLVWDTDSNTITVTDIAEGLNEKGIISAFIMAHYPEASLMGQIVNDKLHLVVGVPKAFPEYKKIAINTSHPLLDQALIQTLLYDSLDLDQVIEFLRQQFEGTGAILHKTVYETPEYIIIHFDLIEPPEHEVN